MELVSQWNLLSTEFFMQYLSRQDNPPFGKEIIQAKFYYVDKFVLLACGNGLHLYKYHIDSGQKDDVKRSGQRYTEFETSFKPCKCSQER